MNPLPEVRRIVTGHDKEGRSRHVLDNDFPTEIIQANDRVVGFKVLWKLDEVPCESNSKVDFNDAAYGKTTDLANGRGATVRVVDFAPGGKAMMHRTASLDYAVVISGRITHIVEQGEPVEMDPGDVLIQRGTMHAWANTSDEWVRMHFVLIGAKPVMINGEALGSAGYKSSDVSTGRDIGHTNGNSNLSAGH